AWPACRATSASTCTRTRPSVTSRPPGPHQDTNPAVSRSSAAMVCLPCARTRAKKSRIDAVDSSAVAHMSTLSGCSCATSQAGGSGNGRSNTSPKYSASPAATCLTRPSRLVPVGVSGRRRSYSPRPSSFQSRASCSSSRYRVRDSLRSSIPEQYSRNRTSRQASHGSTASQQCGALVDGHAAGSNAAHQVVGLILRGPKVPAVEPVADEHRQPAEPLVAIHERVVPGDGLQQCRGLLVHRRIRLAAPEYGGRSMRGRIQQADVAHHAHAEVFGQSQQVLDGEVDGRLWDVHC